MTRNTTKRTYKHTNETGKESDTGDGYSIGSFAAVDASEHFAGFEIYL